MSKITIGRVTNANVYIGGNNLLGKAAEVTLPEVKYKSAEHKALGMIGSVELFSGIEKLEAKFKWTSIYEDVLKEMANPFKPVGLQVRSSIENWTSSGRTEEVPCVIHLTGTPQNFPLGTYKAGENVELESTLSCTYVKVEVGGKNIYELDVLANIFKIEGKDILEKYKSNLGSK